MIKSTLFRQPPKQVKPQQCSSNKTISLAEVAQQLQCTAIAEDNSFSVELSGGSAIPLLSSKNYNSKCLRTELCEKNAFVDVPLKTCDRSQNHVGRPTGTSSVGSLDTNRSHASDSCAKRVASNCQVQCSKKVEDGESLIVSSQLSVAAKTSLVHHSDTRESYSTGRSPVHEKWAVHSSQIVEHRACRRLLLDLKPPSQGMVASPSAFGLTLCFNAKRSKSLLVCHDGRKLRPARSRRSGFTNELVGVSHLAVTNQTQSGISSLNCPSVFDFSTPSPDDLVKEKQKSAFGS